MRLGGYAKGDPRGDARGDAKGCPRSYYQGHWACKVIQATMPGDDRNATVRTNRVACATTFLHFVNEFLACHRQLPKHRFETRPPQMQTGRYAHKHRRLDFPPPEAGSGPGAGNPALGGGCPSPRAGIPAPGAGEPAPGPDPAPGCGKSYPEAALPPYKQGHQNLVGARAPFKFEV